MANLRVTCECGRSTIIRSHVNERAEYRDVVDMEWRADDDGRGAPIRCPCGDEDAGLEVCFVEIDEWRRRGNADG